MQVGAKKNISKTKKWADNIYNHFNFVVRVNLLHHVQNEHTWILGKCSHIADNGTDLGPGPPTNPDGKVL